MTRRIKRIETFRQIGDPAPGYDPDKVWGWGKSDPELMNHLMNGTEGSELVGNPDAHFPPVTGAERALLGRLGLDVAFIDELDKNTRPPETTV